MYSSKKNPIKSRLSSQFLIVILGIIISVFTVIYLYSVPLIKQKVFEIERHSSRLALNNVYEIASRMYASLEEYRAQALNHHQQQLKVAVSLTESFLRTRFREAHRNGITMENARKMAFSDLREFTYGNNDYIWVANKDAVLLSHPDPRYHGKSSNEIVDNSGQAIVANVTRLAMQEGEGFYRYQWNRLSESAISDKVSYVKHFPEWGIVIGSGVYLDDLEQEVSERKERALNDLREALGEIKLAKTGYLYVFDSDRRMLIHPNPNIDGTNFATLLNPKTKNSISDDLIAVADTGKELLYQWDKPSDQGHYEYEKLSLVRYLEGFDWYICSSVYLDELRSSSHTLSNRIMTLATLTLIGALLISTIFVNHITRPLEQLAKTALRVRRGDLSAKTGIKRNDEVGILASGFDSMVERLSDNIDSLDSKVKQRTEELLETNAKAQRMSAVGQLAGGLAHDFNNLLSIIMGNLILAKEQFPQVTGLDKYLSPALRASKRGADITQRLLAFSRRQPLRPKITLIQTLIQETTDLLRGTLGEQIEVTFIANIPHPTYVNVDPSHLENTLINLALNARDAMPDGGKLVFSCALKTGPIANNYDETVEPGSYIEISVRDTGFGFSEEALRLAFEPFFSTKPGNNNSGLGLSMVYGFVKQSHGYIRIFSDQQGAEVQLLLPIHENKTAEITSRSGSTPTFELNEKLFLLVEDNIDVRHVVREQMISLGLNVIEAGDAEEAEQLMTSITDIDGMVSDINMPGANDGWYLANLLREKLPHSVILLISGYSFDTHAPACKNKEFPVLRKPFEKDALATALMLAAEQEENTI